MQSAEGKGAHKLGNLGLLRVEMHVTCPKPRGSFKILEKAPSRCYTVGSSALSSFPSARNLKRILSVLYLVCDLVCPSQASCTPNLAPATVSSRLSCAPP